MKRLFIAILLVVAMASCVDTFHGNYGIVEQIELVKGYNGEPPKYKYKVTVHHESNVCDSYELYTNELYHVGDTLEIRLKPADVRVLTEEIYEEKECLDSISKQQ